MKSIARKLTYANVVSTLALFLALGLGGAYAASKITSKDLAKGSVKSKAIKDKTIVGKDVKDGKLSGADLADGSIGSADLAAGNVLHPTLGNGDQNDCLWLDSPPPGFARVAVHKNGFGEVTLDGIVSPVAGPGGDATCSGAGPESAEDSTVLVLPPAYTPANTEYFVNPTGASVLLVVGANGATFGATPLTPGAVESAVSGPAFLNEISFLAADAPTSDAPLPGRAKISESQLRVPVK